MCLLFDDEHALLSGNFRERQDEDSNEGNLTPQQPQISQINFSITPIINAIKSTNLIYSDTLIKRFAYSLMAKPFVILSGLAGSGKTQLALAFAKCLCENIDEQLKVVPVGADWTNREPLLGYPNALNSNEYVKTEKCVVDLLVNAQNNPEKPYFLVLDEMNMSVVERYFADFLSVMESNEEIPLWNGSDTDNTPKSVALPKNLYIIGTINVDETTYMFSPKVLDRANVIEFKISSDEMDSFLQNQAPIDKNRANSVCANMAQDFVKLTREEPKYDSSDATKDILLGFFNQLKSVNSEFGYRTLAEMFRYIALSKSELREDLSLDTAILQKMLPKLHGSKKKLGKTINALWRLCYSQNPIDIEGEDNLQSADIRYKESAEKIMRMYRAMLDNGFTSFAEA